MTPLSDFAFNNLSHLIINDNGSSSYEAQQSALKALLNTFQAGLNDSLLSLYHIASIDPGMGKTQALVHFIRVWKKDHFRPSGGILVCVSTIEQIAPLIRDTGLKKDELAVLTRNDEVNNLGLPREDHDKAPVMITTQQMILRRTRGGSFLSAREFHYSGRPRSLRVWDESILPRLPTKLSLDNLAQLFGLLRHRLPDWTAILDELHQTAFQAEKNATIRVPDALALSPSQLREMRGLLTDSNRTKDIETLMDIAGAEVAVYVGNHGGRYLVGSTAALPDDIKPLIVLDASARVRTTYKVWSANDSDMLYLPKAERDYGRLKIHLWSSACGRGPMSNDNNIEKIAKVVAELFEHDPQSEWMVLTYKEATSPLKAAIARETSKDQMERIHFTHWGRHMATNDFRTARNIVIIGQYRYDESDYIAHAMAASGLNVDDPNFPSLSEMQNGETAHHFLQAICRGSIRNASGTQEGDCNVFLMTSVPAAEAMMKRVFPGCHIETWRKDCPMSPSVQAAIKFTLDRFASDGVEFMRKKELREALGLKSAAALNLTILNNPDWQDFLADAGLTTQGQKIERVACSFPPMPDPMPEASQGPRQEAVFAALDL